MKRQRVNSQKKEQDKLPQKELNEAELGNLPGKEFQNNNSEDDPGSQKKKGEDARNVYQRPRRTKEQINRNKQYTGEINSIITEAEDRMSDLKDKVVESLQQGKIQKNE